MTAADISVDRVAELLSQRLPIYKWRRPVYQAAMLSALAEVWDPATRRLLDIGGGTGVIAQAVHDLFGVDKIVSIDVEDRFLQDLQIETATYDGRRLPFPDGAFDAVMFNNVLHHVEVADRPALIRECRRVAPHGALYIKDHLARSPLDHLRLGALDFIGNVPFHGMVKARYLEAKDWEALAAEGGYRIERRVAGRYRSGPFGLAFPNTLEITMKWVPA